MTLGSGGHVPADYADEAATTLRTADQALAGATGALLLGAGPVGLELAGEIKAAWPETAVTIVDPVPDILGATALPKELRAEVRRQLDELGVELVLGTDLQATRQAGPVTPARSP